MNKYIEEKKLKIEKLVGSNDWDFIRVKYKLPFIIPWQVYNDMLDECYNDPVIAGFTYQTSRVFKLIDPIAYDQGLADYLDAEQQDGIFFESDGFIFYEDTLDDLLNKLNEKGS